MFFFDVSSLFLSFHHTNVPLKYIAKPPFKFRSLSEYIIYIPLQGDSNTNNIDDVKCLVKGFGLVIGLRGSVEE